MAEKRFTDSKVKLLVVAVVVLILMGMLINGQLASNGSQAASNQSSSEQQEPASETTANSSSDVNPSNEVVENTSSDTDIINQFLQAYNATSSSPIEDIRPGNTSKKFYGHTYGRYTEILYGADGALHITVSADKDYPSMGDLQEAFCDIATCLDSALSSDEVLTAYDALLAEDHLAEDVELGILKVTWVPTKELSSGTSVGHLEISVPVDSLSL